MAESSLYDESLVEGVCRLFSCCSIRSKAIIDQATEFNYLDILEGQVKNHDECARKDKSNTDAIES